MKRNIFKMLHTKCRNNIYPMSEIQRFTVPDDKVQWKVDFPQYKPIEYTSKAVEGKIWADPKIEDDNFKPEWNSLDDNGKVNRLSFTGNYEIDECNYPLNPMGRTGIRGRGTLGKWGPNHAADPIVTRWKRNAEKKMIKDSISARPILQFVGIQRKDCGEWALPGGMVDPGEKVSVTVRREFMEEALNVLEKSESESKELLRSIEQFFARGERIFEGYVDDPRNTDNSWMETVAFNFHDEDGSVIGAMNLQAGDDAKNVKWLDVSGNLELYASHKDLVNKVAEKLGAHWL